MRAAIEVQGLFVTYSKAKGPKVDAVRGLNFSVSEGEIVGFLGPNGAGKSSTIKALMGFLRPNSGSAQVLGFEAGSMQANALCGYLPEVAMYYPYLTPLETLCLYGDLQRLPKAKLKVQAVDLLEQLGLKDALHKQNRALSKGMLQRVGIAQSLLGEPKVLILDEVTSGLDPVGRQELRALLKSKQAEGCTLFFSSHELAEVTMLCDRILIVNKGELIEERNLEALRTELRRFQISFTGHASMVGLTDDLSEDSLGRVVARFASKDLLLQAIDRVRESGGEIADLVAEEDSLEDYFIETIGRAA